MEYLVDGVFDAFVVDGGGDEVGGVFDYLFGVAHSHPDAGPAEHLEVVGAVAESEGFLLQPRCR